MKSALTFFVLKHLYTGLFWNEMSECWNMPSNVVDVYRLKSWTSEQEALEYFNKTLLSIPQTDHRDVIISTIVIETKLIF